ncbi:tetratricopeptide repeat protein [Candidatus Woesearchaeota archaeon]|nr:tetratricopeptide repeat protein [Candidatus Woesearchaeota archaeon]
MIVLRFSKRKIRIAIFRFLLIIILLEVVLRVNAFGYIAWQRHQNKAGNTMGTYRILALGGSETADLRNGQGSWPEELGVILNKESKNVKFKVFNEGISPGISYDIVRNLNDNLDKYKPHVVITMMGVNEPDFYFKPKDNQKIILILKDFRIYNLIKFSIKSLKQEIIKKIEWYREKKYKAEERKLKMKVEKEPGNLNALAELGKFYGQYGKYAKSAQVAKKLLEVQPDDFKPQSNLGYGFFLAGMYEDAERVLKKIIELKPDDKYAYLYLAQLYIKTNRPREALVEYLRYLQVIKEYDEHVFIQSARLYMQLNNSFMAYTMLKGVIEQNSGKIEEIFWIGELYEKLEKTNETVELLRRTIEKNQTNYAAYAELAWHYLKNNRSQEAEGLLENIKEKNAKIMAYGTLATRYEKNRQFDEADKMINKAFKESESYYRPTPKENYRKLYKTLNERGIKLIAMQYPTLDVRDLKNYFRGDEDIIFVSNEENFKKALENASYNEYFLDNIRPTFGHPTLKANQLVTENVANVILKELKLE